MRSSDLVLVTERTPEDWLRFLESSGRAELWPTQKDEFWKYSKASVFQKADYAAVTTGKAQEFDALPSQWKSQLSDLKNQVDGFLLFCNGVFQEKASQILQNPSARFEVQSGPAQKALLLSVGEAGQNAFLARNLQQDGPNILLKVAGADRPLTFAIVNIYDHAADSYRVGTRHHIHIEGGAKVSLLEMHLSLTVDQNFSVNQFNQVRVEGASTFERLRIFNGNEKTLVFDHDDMTIAKGAQVRNLVANIGGRWVRCESEARIEDAESLFQSYGFYLTTGDGHVDHSTRIDHVSPKTNSEQIYKGLLLDASRGVFNGKVVIQQDAQKSDAKQLNQNLLLGAKAEVDTRPQLEVFADDVKAAHGATIGRLNQDEIFYLRSRGVDQGTAVAMVARGFMRDLSEKMNSTLLKGTFDSVVDEAFAMHVEKGLGS